MNTTLLPQSFARPDAGTNHWNPMRGGEGCSRPANFHRLRPGHASIGLKLLALPSLFLLLAAPAGAQNPSVSLISVSASGAVINWSGDVLEWAPDLKGPFVVVTTNQGSFIDEGHVAGFFRARDGGYSAKVVGFYRLSMRPGVTPLVNQFIRTDNTVAAMFPSVPNGFTVYRVGPSGYEANTFLGGWTQPGASIQVGEAFLMYNPSADSLMLSFGGEVPQGTLVQNLQPGLTLCGLMAPMYGRLSSELHFPAAEGDQVYELSFDTDTIYLSGTYDSVSQSWDPLEPDLNLGKAFWVYKNGGTTWTQYVSVNGDPVAGSQIWSPYALSSSDGQVTFFTLNTDTNLGRVFDVDGVTPLEGGFRGQLYADTNSAGNNLLPVGNPASFLPGEMAGYINGGVVTIPGTTNWQTVYLQLRVWEAARGTTYESAQASGSRIGLSEIFSLELAAPLGEFVPGGIPPVANQFHSFRLGSCWPIVILQQPQSAKVPPGGNVILSASVDGTSPFYYQWLKNGDALPGATSSAWSITGAQTNDAGDYQVIVTNYCGAVTSAVAVVEIGIPPVIVRDIDAGFPLGILVRQPEQALDLTVVAEGSSPLSYEWYHDGALLTVQATETLSIPAVTLADAGNYSVMVTNSFGVALSHVVQVRIPCQPIVLLQQPQSVAGDLDEDVVLSVTVAGTPPFHYQWWQWGFIPVGEDAPKFTNTVSFTNIGSYYVTVSNCWGLTVWSIPAVVTMTGTPTNYSLPAITFQPQDATAYEGGSAHFDVGVDGDAPLGISWRHNGTLIPSANAPSLELTNVSLSAAGTYQLFAINAHGATNSRAATLTVLTNARSTVAITNPAPNTTYLVPANLPIQVAASDPDGSVLGVELYANGQLVAAVDHAPYDFYYQVTNAGARTFTAVATDNNGARSSCSIPLSFVLPPVQMTFQADASLLLHLVVPPGVRAVTVEVSADLNQWATLTNAPTSGAALDVTDPAAAASAARFYRVRYSLP